MTRSGSIGTSTAELARAVDVAMGRYVMTTVDDAIVLAPLPQGSTPRQVDLVMLDQNLEAGMDSEIGANRLLLGSDLAMHMREQGFRGVISIITGSSEEEIKILRNLKAVDLVLAKGTPVVRVTNELRAAVLKKRLRTKKVQ
jgi:hypothetical protein